MEFIAHFVGSLGLIWGPIMAIISICLVALIIMLFLDLRMGVAVPTHFVEEFTDTVNKRQFKQAFDLARNDSSFVARVLTAGMSRLQYGLEDAREAAINMLDSVKSSKERLNSYLALVGTIGPLLGLVGTVVGMIGAFRKLGGNTADAVEGAAKTLNAAALSVEISHALCMTLAGVFLAVVALFFNALFKNRIINVSMEAGNIADDLLTQMYHNSKKPAPAGPVPTPVPGMAPVDQRAPAGVVPVKQS
jgi:biopolymer transport protein ExbB